MRTLHRTDPDAYLRPLLVLAIGLLFGPEVFLAADMVALVDLFGVALFLLVFATSYAVLLYLLLQRLTDIFLPVELTILVSRGNPAALRVHGVLLAAGHAMRLGVFGLVALVGVLGLASLL